MARSFSDEVAASLPKGLLLPAEFRAALDWMEAEGAVGQMKDGQRYAMTDPGELYRRGGCKVYFHTASQAAVRAWTGSNAAELNRLAPIIRTGGDGSMAGLWRDDEGLTRIVHLGSGSGSILFGTFTRSALDFLRLLAVGYQELCWQDSYEMLPIDACYDRSTYKAPMRFRTWLATTFDVAIPSTASSLVLPMADIGEDSEDPFCRWVNAQTA